MDEMSPMCDLKKKQTDKQTMATKKIITNIFISHANRDQTFKDMARKMASTLSRVGK